jgi:dihydrofolate reductase
MMAAYWPTVADDPDATRHDLEHSRWTDRATKLVFSSTLREAPWGAGSATLVGGDASTALRTLKQQPGGDMVLLGSASLARSLIRDGLVDEYRINVNPVVLGDGTSLFPEMADARRLKLEGVHPFASGVVGLHYSAEG